MSETAAPVYILPSALVTRADLSRIVREVEDLDNELEAQKARNHSTGKTGYHLPGTSKGLNDFLEANKLDILNDQGRMRIKEQLRVMKDKAPIMHLTFATEADPEFLSELVAWLREQIHPQTLVSVGLQPALVGGVYVRTPNHVHDFSLRELMAGKRQLITKQLDELMRGVVAGADGPVIQTGDVPVVEMPAYAEAPLEESEDAVAAEEPAAAAEPAIEGEPAEAEAVATPVPTAQTSEQARG